jgi:hypothetical protein
MTLRMTCKFFGPSRMDRRLESQLENTSLYQRSLEKNFKRKFRKYHNYVLRINKYK